MSRPAPIIMQTPQESTRTDPPEKTDADIQDEAQKQRQDLALSTRGFASTILTSGLGLVGGAGTPQIGGITLSGR